MLKSPPMSSKLGTPLPRKSPSWFLFILAALSALYSTWAALFGYVDAWLPLGFGIAAAFVLLAPKLRNIQHETVQVDDTGVQRVDGAIRQQIRWEDVAEVRVVAGQAGPWRDELFYTLDGTDGASCVIPHEAAIRTRLLDHLQSRFPTLDNEAFHDAMGSRSRRHFVLWRRSPGGSSITTIH